MGRTSSVRKILAVDIEGFGRPDWSDADRIVLRGAVHALLDHALAAAQIPRSQVTISGTGDGLFALFDPKVSTATLLHPLLTDLTAQLAAYNRAAGRGSPERLRLRVALHEGSVFSDQHGYGGEDLNYAFRLLDVPVTRAVLAASPRPDGVLVVSDAVYGAVRRAGQGVDPAGWRRIDVYGKETRTHGWVYLLGPPRRPDVPGTSASPPAGPASMSISRELPAPIRHFVGRANELRLLHRLLDPTEAAGGPGPVVAIDGLGGVGKTALALQFARERADRFPDGQVYVNLHGAPPDRPPLDPAAALGQLLHSLGEEPAAIPADVDEAVARWRSLVAGRRLLLVLDNAHGADQVYPLLPASPTCVVLITSREALTTLDPVRRVHLDLLPQEQMVELLAQVAGRERISSEPDAARKVVRLCGGLPLAVRIVGARLAARPTLTVGELAQRLEDANRWLEEQTVHTVGVAAALLVALADQAGSTGPFGQADAETFRELSGHDVRRQTGAAPDAEPLHRSIIAIDIDGYGRADRIDRDRLRLRGDLRRLLSQALASRAIPVDSLFDVGDGLIAVIDAAVAKTRLVEALLVDLPGRLADHNLGLAERERLRLRVALLAGELVRDEHGYAGDAMVTAAGLVKAEVLRASLTLIDGDLAIAVADPIYRGVIEPGYTTTDAARFRPVQVRVGAADTRAWLYVPESSSYPPSLPPPSANPGPEPPDSHYRSIFLADIEGYSERPNAVKGRLRDQLYRLVTGAISAADITPDQYDPPVDQGDGLLVLFGPEVAKNRLLCPLIPHLTDGLVEYNAGVPVRERMRLRVVVDAGDLRRDDRGYYGTDLDEAFGLVNSDELRACLAQAASPMVVAVSSEVYEGIVRHEYNGIDPGTYRLITVRLKHRDLTAWVHHPRPQGSA